MMLLFAAHSFLTPSGKTEGSSADVTTWNDVPENGEPGAEQFESTPGRQAAVPVPPSAEEVWHLEHRTSAATGMTVSTDEITAPGVPFRRPVLSCA